MKIDYLVGKRNLLAFSGGVDSSALFFMLIAKEIDFDIIMVNYNMRAQSKLEVSYAEELSQTYSKKLFLKDVSMSKNDSNLEAVARNIRYDFFYDICITEQYDNIITAHHINDRMEWFLMQMSKGAGFEEMIGMEYLSERENYTVVRPLLDTSRDEIQEYLDTNGFKYFIDDTNYDTSYTRNHFRHNYSNAFVSEFKEGVKKSFEYLDNDKKRLPTSEVLKLADDFFKFEKQDSETVIKALDKLLKKEYKYVMSNAMRTEVINNSFNAVIGRKWVVAEFGDFIYLCLKSDSIISKEAKELFRKQCIPSSIRPFLFERGITTI